MIPCDKAFKKREINKDVVCAFKQVKVKGVQVFTDFLKLDDSTEFPIEFMTFFKDNHWVDS